MSFFSDLQTRAAAEIATLKSDVSSIETRIEEAFNLGAMHQALQSLEAEAISLEDKLKAAFKLGQASK